MQRRNFLKNTSAAGLGITSFFAAGNSVTRTKQTKENFQQMNLN